MSTYEISKSSLLSLKAEILRKQEDLTKAKAENADKIKVIKKKTPLEIKNKGVEDRSRYDLNEEEQDLLKLSKSKLEAKARLYDKLSGNMKGNDDLNRKYLVRFDKKKKISDGPPSDSEEPPDLPEESEDEDKHLSDEYNEEVDASEEWVEFTDCLGRARKCLRKDLEFIKAKDKELRSTVEERQQNQKTLEKEFLETHDEPEIHNLDSQECDKVENKESELISGEMRRETLRKQWEKEEEELRNKTDVHYQNVLFNEARQHGVGYYAFSKDEEERAKQQEALKKLREETAKEQKRAQELKSLREKQLAARIKAARNRKRARMGLPPEEDEPEVPEEKQKPTEEDKQKQEEKQRDEEAEKLLAEARKKHVRPWDMGKEGVKEHYEMTQHEWNEKKRQERPKDFAPPKIYSKRAFSGMKSLEDDPEEVDKSLKFTSRRKVGRLNPYKNSKKEDSLHARDTEDDDCLLRDFYVSQSMPHPQVPTPIVNELESEPDTGSDEDQLEDLRKRGVEIAPPPTDDYYGPSETKRTKKSDSINISDSIEAGLRFLRQQAERK